MTTMNPLQYPNSFLKEVDIQPVQADAAAQLKELFTNITDTMEATQAQGLAAPQIGSSLSVIGIRDPSNKIRLLVNPVIVQESKETVVSEEGCLSFPGVTAKVRRNQVVTVLFTDSVGEAHEEPFYGLQSVAVQHEIDHLYGILLVDRLVGNLNKKLFLQKYSKVKKAMSRRRGTVKELTNG